MEKVEIKTEYIRLCDALKYSGAVGTGGQAKLMIEDGAIFVNGEVCKMRGKKLRSGDIFSISEDKYEII